MGKRKYFFKQYRNRGLIVLFWWLGVRLYISRIVQQMDFLSSTSVGFFDRILLINAGASFYSRGDALFVQRLPMFWIAFYFIWGFFVFTDLRVDREALGTQIVIRYPSREKRFRTLYKRMIVTSFLKFAALLLLALIPYLFTGERIGGLNRELLDAWGIMIGDAGVPAVVLKGILVPGLILTALSVLILVLHTALRREEKIPIFLIIYILLCLFSSNPLFILNHNMMIRVFDESARISNALYGIITGFTVIAAGYFLGKRAAKKKEYL